MIILKKLDLRSKQFKQLKKLRIKKNNKTQ